MPMRASFGIGRVKDMAKKLFTKGFQQKILGFKMGVEGGSSYVRFPNDLSHRNLPVSLFGKQRAKSFKDRLSRFFLASVHIFPHTIL
jgi:hypothetical protein